MTKPILAAIAMLLNTGAGAWAAPSPIPRAVISAGLKQADCSLTLKDSLDGISVSDLGRALKLVEVPCWLAAYQAGSIFFAVDPAAPAKAWLLRFQKWDGSKLVQTFSLTMPDFAADTTLSSFHKGRGLGDCGSISEWAWGGAHFKLTGLWVKNECDGEPFPDEADKDKWRVYPPRR